MTHFKIKSYILTGVVNPIFCQNEDVINQVPYTHWDGLTCTNVIKKIT